MDNIILIHRVLNSEFQFTRMNIIEIKDLKFLVEAYEEYTELISKSPQTTILETKA